MSPRDLAHEADMRELRAEQLREDCGCDQDDLDELAEADELADIDFAPTAEELAEWDADHDAQYQSYHN